MASVSSASPNSHHSVVVQIVQHLQPGGLEIMVLNLHQANREYQPMYIISLEGAKEDLLATWPALAPFADQIYCLAKPSAWSLTTIYRLTRLLYQLRPKVVHTHHIGPLIYGGLASKLAFVPKLIHTDHDAWYLDDPHLCQLAKGAIKILRPVLIANAAPVARQVQDRLGPDQLQVIVNGIDEQRFKMASASQARECLGLPSDVKLIGCAARLELVKGHDLLLLAMTYLPQDVHLALAGVGSLQPELEKQCVQLEITSRVHFLGLVNDMPCFYQGLDLFCLPSLAEGMPLSILEAQACGVPVVMSAVGAAQDIVCPQSGQLLTTRDPQHLTQLLTLGLQHSEDIRQLTREFVCKQGTLKQMVEAYRLVYSD
ncbi:glycosyltransferase [Aeromonas cavernicola]|uniref:Glycosyl transferase n=1 Tax=Aeromonas cavernicola TaxID=1006623 RepID=A0A2H9U392_9GAMM|nr:glycosyltransferase [Aeromonas cavernicola]PJG58484.1 glycosyl transferase [Aeromonas cavernicola]